MAILEEEERKPINWSGIIFFLIIIGILGALAYYLFFAPTPGIELITPVALKEASQILESPLDINAILNHKIFKTLKPYVSPITVGNLGRDNPFTPF